MSISQQKMCISQNSNKTALTKLKTKEYHQELMYSTLSAERFFVVCDSRVWTTVSAT